MIDKKSVYFRIAAFSLKYPKRTYLGLFSAFVLCGISALLIGRQFTPHPVIESVTNSTPVTSRAENNWMAKKKWSPFERSECILYEHKITHDTVVSCYKKLQSGDWVLEYSY